MFKDLERYKKRAVEDAFDIINQNFRQIYEKLLPNSSAILLPQNTSIHTGIKVTFCYILFSFFSNKTINGVSRLLCKINVTFLDEKCKTSRKCPTLSQLSGGQKTLLSLSLLFALLRYNPAPIYILDEVDAALDLSHTANIGC